METRLLTTAILILVLVCAVFIVARGGWDQWQRDKQLENAQLSEQRNMGRTLGRSRSQETETATKQEYAAIVSEAQQAEDWETSGFALLRLGGIEHRDGRLRSAEEYYNQALADFRKAKDKSGEAAAIHEIGGIRLMEGRYPEAETQFKNALKLRQDCGDRDGEAASWNELGSVHMKMDFPDDAKREYDTALDIWKSLGDDAKVAEVTHNVGAVYHAELRDQYVYAASWGNQPQLDDEEEERDWVQYRYEMALEYYGKSLDQFQRLGDQWWVAELYYQIGCVHTVVRKTDLARKALLSALDVHKRYFMRDDGSYRFTVKIAWIYHSMGSTYHKDGNAEEALKWYHMAEELWISLQDQPRLAHTQHEIGGVYQMIGDVENAMLWYRKALEIRLDLIDQHDAAYTYYEMGNTTGDPEYYKEALKRAEDPKIRDIHLESGCREKLGMEPKYYTDAPAETLTPDLDKLLGLDKWFIQPAPKAAESGEDAPDAESPVVTESGESATPLEPAA